MSEQKRKEILMLGLLSSPLLSSPGLSVGISMATERWSGLVWRVQTVSATAVMARPAWQQQPHYSCHDSLEWGRHGTGRHVCLAARFVMILHLSLSLWPGSSSLLVNTDTVFSVTGGVRWPVTGPAAVCCDDPGAGWRALSDPDKIRADFYKMET